MSTDFVVTSENIPSKFYDRVNINDAVTYRFDCTPWQEDNSTVTAVTVVVENGQAGVSGEALASGVKTFVVTCGSAGKSLISLLITTATERKKVFLQVKCVDPTADFTDDYGLGA